MSTDYADFTDSRTDVCSNGFFDPSVRGFALCNLRNLWIIPTTEIFHRRGPSTDHRACDSRPLPKSLLDLPRESARP